MPNTKVNFSSGIAAGIIAGTAYQFLQWIYINFQIFTSNYNAIYGSFAALPLFLVWLQLSWLIVLVGAEISFAHQNVDTYEFEPDCLSASRAFRKLLALRITHYLVKKFAQGQEPGTATEVSHALEIPIRLVRDILFELTGSGILIETKTKDPRELGLQPARDIDTLSIKYVIDSMEHKGTEDVPVLRDKELQGISEALQTFSATIEKSPSNRLLKEI
jgi:membrane protein